MIKVNATQPGSLNLQQEEESGCWIYCLNQEGKNKNVEIKASTSGDIIHNSTTKPKRKRSVADQPKGDSVSRTTKKSKAASKSSGRKRSAAEKDAENIDNHCNNGSEELSENDDSDDEDYEFEG